MLVALYVDDFRIVCDAKKDLLFIEQSLKTTFKMKNNADNQWLGLKIDKSADSIYVSARANIEKLLHKYGMSDSKAYKTPVAPGSKLPKVTNTSNQDNFPYREAVGALLWLARTARPDIVYAVSELSKHCNAYGTEHITAVKRVLRYLKGTPNLGVMYRKSSSLTLELFIDANFGGEGPTAENPMRSTTGFVLMAKGVGPIACVSKLQATVAKSTAEAEYAAISDGVKQLQAIRAILIDMGLISDQGPVQVYNDNQSAIYTANNITLGSNMRHVQINYHHVRELIQQKLVQVSYLQTSQMVADMFTKALPREAFDKHRDFLMWN
jgi:ribonuclease HI